MCAQIPPPDCGALSPCWFHRGERHRFYLDAAVVIDGDGAPPRSDPSIERRVIDFAFAPRMSSNLLPPTGWNGYRAASRHGRRLHGRQYESCPRAALILSVI
jgi:hypothetical protein